MIFYSLTETVDVIYLLLDTLLNLYILSQDEDIK